MRRPPRGVEGRLARGPARMTGTPPWRRTMVRHFGREACFEQRHASRRRKPAARRRRLAPSETPASTSQLARLGMTDAR